MPMKYAGILIPVYLLFSSIIQAQQGSSCSNPYIIPLDTVSHEYTISSVTGTALHCTNPIYSGSGYITVFSFTTNATGSCVLIDLTNDGNPAEAMLYSKCSGGGALQNGDANSSVCFDDGTGLWAPSETYTLAPNKTYFLRVWTPNTGNLHIAAKSYPPPNDDCYGATIIGPTPVADNNACHKPGPGVLPEQLCAFSLENTAFYSYTVDVTGISVLMINNIQCDNSAAGATAGFQIGFFTGSCDNLTPINCYSGTGGSVSAPTNSFPSGTQIIVAIDGMSGSNCTYTISAFNAVFLPVTIKYFTGWLNGNSNLLRWQISNRSGNSYFEVERSRDGYNFLSIGTIEQPAGSVPGVDYSFEDRYPPGEGFYRLKVTGDNGKIMYSNIVHLKRTAVAQLPISFQNPATDKLDIRIHDLPAGVFELKVLNASGDCVRTKNIQVNKTDNQFEVNIETLPKGVYYLVINNNILSKGYCFIKQ
jgi:hypothetical protein